MEAAQPAESVVALIRRHDPNGYALQRAIRAAIVIPVAFAIASQVIGDSQVATFAAFGSFALLLFVDFPGSRAGRFGSYLLLALVGAALITLGSLASSRAWVATVSMAVIGFAVLFAGVVSAATAAAGRAALLTFILPVTLPADAGDIPLRLGGWGLAVAFSVPAALLLWPPREHDALRARAAAVCAALANSLDARLSALAVHDAAQASRDTLTDLRSTFRGTTFRPVGLTTGSRALVRLVDELEWLHSIIAQTDPAEVPQWPQLAREVCAAATGVLRASAEGLRMPPAQAAAPLRVALADLEATRPAVVRATRAGLTSADGVHGPYQAHEIAYAASLVGTTVSWAVAADARPLLATLLGRRPVSDLLGPLVPAGRLISDHIEWHSVWLRNSIRGAVGLSAAVLLAQLTGAQHAFWVVLGALSVLRSNALSTGSTVLRAVLGTAAGFLVGGLLVFVIGTDSAVLWALLPVAVLFAGFAPEAISFAVGQAGFTVVVLILFNIIQPTGWRVGLVRIEDVVLGCAASLAVGLLFWPRGAAGAIGTALSEAYRAGADYLRAAVDHAVHRGSGSVDGLSASLAAAHRMDDALRQYLAERGAKNVDLVQLTKALNGATRLRLAGQAIAGLPGQDPLVDTAPFAGANDLLSGRAVAVHAWYSAVADTLDPRRRGASVYPPTQWANEPSVHDTLRRELLASCPPDDEHVEHARLLLWAALYLHDLQVLEPQLAPAISAIAAEPTRQASSAKMSR